MATTGYPTMISGTVYGASAGTNQKVIDMSDGPTI